MRERLLDKRWRKIDAVFQRYHDVIWENLAEGARDYTEVEGVSFGYVCHLTDNRQGPKMLERFVTGVYDGVAVKVWELRTLAPTMEKVL